MAKIDERVRPEARSDESSTSGKPDRFEMASRVRWLLKRTWFEGIFSESEQPYLVSLLFGVYVSYGHGLLATKKDAMEYMGIVDARTAQRYTRIAQEATLLKVVQSKLDQRVDYLCPTDGLISLIEQELESFADDLRYVLGDDRSPEVMPIGSFALRPLGDPEKDSNRSKNMIAKCSEIINLLPEISAAYRNRAMQYWDAGDSKRALDDCARAIQLTPSDWRYFDMRAQMHEQLGDLKAAYADWSQIIRIMADDPRAYHRRGCFLYFTCHDYKRAAEDFSEAIKRELERGADDQKGVLVTCYVLRARTHVELGQLEEARADLRLASKIDPMVGIMNNLKDPEK
jgi:tetratricopeptide (TPR) repeat protein